MSGLVDVNSLAPLARYPGAIVIESPLPTIRPSLRPPRSQLRPIDPIDDQESARSAGARARSRQSESEQAQRKRLNAGEASSGNGVTVAAPRPALTTLRFAAQLIGQETVAGREGNDAPSAQHLARGHEAYRRAGGEPVLYPETAALFRLSA